MSATVSRFLRLMIGDNRADIGRLLICQQGGARRLHLTQILPDLSEAVVAQAFKETTHHRASTMKTRNAFTS